MAGQEDRTQKWRMEIAKKEMGLMDQQRMAKNRLQLKLERAGVHMPPGSLNKFYQPDPTDSHRATFHRIAQDIAPDEYISLQSIKNELSGLSQQYADTSDPASAYKYITPEQDAAEAKRLEQYLPSHMRTEYLAKVRNRAEAIRLEKAHLPEDQWSDFVKEDLEEAKRLEKTYLPEDQWSDFTKEATPADNLDLEGASVVPVEETPKEIKIRKEQQDDELLNMNMSDPPVEHRTVDQKNQMAHGQSIWENIFNTTKEAVEEGIYDPKEAIGPALQQAAMSSVDEEDPSHMDRVRRRMEDLNELLGDPMGQSTTNKAIEALQKRIDEAENRGFLPTLLEAVALVFGGQDVRQAMGMMRQRRTDALNMQLKQIEMMRMTEKQRRDTMMKMYLGIADSIFEQDEAARRASLQQREFDLEAAKAEARVAQEGQKIGLREREVAVKEAGEKREAKEAFAPVQGKKSLAEAEEEVGRFVIGFVKGVNQEIPIQLGSTALEAIDWLKADMTPDQVPVFGPELTLVNKTLVSMYSQTKGISPEQAHHLANEKMENFMLSVIKSRTAFEGEQKADIGFEGAQKLVEQWIKYKQAEKATKAKGK